MKNSTMSSYKHVLKERHYKESVDDERNRRRDKDRNSNSKNSYSHTRKRSHSPHRSTHHKKSPLKSKAESDNSDHHRNRKHHHESDIEELLKSKAESNNSDHHRNRKHHHESDIEELSRQKRKLESELRALDLEEAAQKEAENKKARREKSEYKEVKFESKEVPETKPKPVSNHSDDDRKSSKNKAQNIAVKVEKDRHKGHASRSSGNDKGWGKPEQESKDLNKEKPNTEVSGLLAEETNTYNGVVIKYNEPSEARKPKRKWRLYPFKGESHLPYIPIHRQSAYLFGRTRLIADIPIDHPSCSKQHAVLQYRLVPYKREDGTTGRRVRPYIIDLESSNGTFVNNKKVDPRCYVELVEKDVIKFGYSSREYVLLHEESKNDEEDDDVLETND